MTIEETPEQVYYEPPPPPTPQQLQGYFTPLLQAYAAHLQMKQQEARRQRYRELFNNVYGQR